MVEPGTGNVKSLAQSRPMGGQEGRADLPQLRGPPEVRRLPGFQAGSTFKVFVLAAAIEKGIPLPRRSAHRSTHIEKNNFKLQRPARTLRPLGVSTRPPRGTKDIYTGTRESVNTFFAQLEQLTGLCEPYALAKAMGVDLTARR